MFSKFEINHSKLFLNSKPVMSLPNPFKIQNSIRVLSVDRFSPKSHVLDKAVSILKAGGVVVHPTDTCYGFAVSVNHPEAVKRLYELKQMDGGKPVSVMVSNFSQVEYYGQVTDKVREMGSRFWPGALTVIVSRSKNLPAFFNTGAITVGFRMPDCALCLALVRAFGDILTTTSANISGKPSTYSVPEILDQFKNQPVKPDLVLDGGILPNVLASTVVEIGDTGVKILRQGKVVMD